MTDLIRKTLDHCGYNDEEPTAERLVLCFLDYVDSGAFNNLDLQEATQLIEEGELTVTDMCRNLLRR